MSRRRLAPEILAEDARATRLRRELRVPRDLACWPGHFPAASIVPGVLQLDWVMDAIAAWTGHPAAPETIVGLKFKAILEPGRELALELERDAAGRRVAFRLFAGETTFSQGNVLLRDGGDR